MSQDREETIFCGNCKPIFKKDGTQIGFKLGIEYAKLAEYVNEKGYVNIDMMQRREVGQYGDTHFLKINTWKPNNENHPAPKAPAAKKTTEKDWDDAEMPF